VAIARHDEQVGDEVDERGEGRNRSDRTALEAARRAGAEAFPHQEPEIEAGDVDRRPLGDVLVETQVRAPHAAVSSTWAKLRSSISPRRRITRWPRNPFFRRRFAFTASRSSASPCPS
jgi:hypothetical protein